MCQERPSSGDWVMKKRREETDGLRRENVSYGVHGSISLYRLHYERRLGYLHTLEMLRRLRCVWTHSRINCSIKTFGC
jgi:hypothetical protein